MCIDHAHYEKLCVAFKSCSNQDKQIFSSCVSVNIAVKCAFAVRGRLLTSVQAQLRALLKDFLAAVSYLSSYHVAEVFLCPVSAAAD